MGRISRLKILVCDLTYERPAFYVWIAARVDLDPQQSLNFVTTNDVIGGNSGSPAINEAGEILGVLFNINHQAPGSYFAYDPAVNRPIGVSAGAIREALPKVYHADRLAAELAE